MTISVYILNQSDKEALTLMEWKSLIVFALMHTFLDEKENWKGEGFEVKR